MLSLLSLSGVYKRTLRVIMPSNALAKMINALVVFMSLLVVRDFLGLFISLFQNFRAGLGGGREENIFTHKMSLCNSTRKFIDKLSVH